MDSYKYLGFYLHECMNFDIGSKHLADASSRALGAVINKFKVIKNSTFNIFTKLYNAGVTSLLDYASEVWGYAKAESCDKIQNRALRYY